MRLHLKITAGVLLLVQAVHLAALQNSTDSPGRTIDKSWLRDLAMNIAKGQVNEEETEYDQVADGTGMESTNDYSNGIASGSMAIYRENENETGQEKTASESSNDLTVVTTAEPPTSPNVTAKQPELTTASTDLTNSSQSNMTEEEEEFNNSTTTLQNFPDLSNRTLLNHTHYQATTVAPERNATQEVTKKSGEDTGLTNSTGSTNTTTTVTTTAAPEINKTPTTSSTTPVFPAETTETIPESTTTTSPNTPEKTNLTDKDASSGSNSERGLASDSHRSKKKGAWGAVLGTAVAVVCVGLVAYIILKKKQQKGFSHRKLVEEFPSDPVLRLHNHEPLDLNLHGSAYYNPGLQEDIIQMDNFPGNHRN
ncbi:hypothetical protein PAMA_000756 [Pampus argenteus]